MMGQLNRAKHQRVQLQALVDRFPHRLPIEYDQLNLDSAAVGRQLESFLGVEIGQPMKSRFKKVAPDRLSDAVLNFEDITAAVRQTEFESLLDS
jgi:hypothetical protein